MPQSRKLHVFLCYASQDKNTVKRLYQLLSAERWIDAWRDVEKLLPGYDWEQEIEKAILETDVVIVCLSNNSVNKEGWLQREIRNAVSYAEYKPDGVIYIIPIRLEECSIPPPLKRFQCLDYFPYKNRKEAYRRLKLSLSLRANGLGLNILKKKSQPIKVSNK